LKKVIYILIILFIVSCKNITQANLPAQNIAVTDTIKPILAEDYEVKVDTLTLKSNPFVLNNLLCNWKHFFTIYDNYGLDIEAKLYDYKTKKIILEYEESPKYPEYYYYYKSATYFDSINKNYFEDFNFDGFKDFSIYIYGSMPMTSATAIYLFNNKTKKFESSDLSDTTIDEMDSINKILTTHSWWLEGTLYKKHHFDKNGKVKFREDISESYYYPNDTTEMKIRVYKKIIDEKVIENRTDTINEE
jgi:hypothetical protein